MTTLQPLDRLAPLRFHLVALLLGSALVAPRAHAGLTTPPPPDPVVIHACYVPTSGTLYRIKATDPAETCRSPQHVAIQWNITGPVGPEGIVGIAGPVGPAGPQGAVGAQGPAGAVGPAGPMGGAGAQGAAGPSGPNGVVGIEKVTTTVTNAFISIGEIVVAQCPAGKKVISGGFSVVPNRGELKDSRPDNNNTAWYVWVDKLGGNTSDVSAYALCAPWP